MRFRLFVATLATFLLCCAAATGATAANLRALHNQARAAAGLPPLRWDPRLARAAHAKADDIAACGFYHDACGRSWLAYLPARRCTLGENLLEGAVDRPDVFQGWLNSPHHRANILDPDYRRVGFAHHADIWVAEFSS